MITEVTNRFGDIVSNLDESQITELVQTIISESGSLTTGEDGEITLDFSSLTEDQVKEIVSQIIGSDSGLTTDSSGKITIDFSNLSDEQASEIIENIISENGGLTTDEDGKIIVDFSDMDTSIITNVVNAMVQEGGGLSVDENGQLYVDFDSMDTTKFENMVKSIHVPIWLERNTTFYVDCDNGDDTEDDGKGLSSSKPFKTIQACINYVTDNYNLSRYIAYINIAPGTYNESVEIPEYSRTTGYLYIRLSTQNKDDVTIQGVPTTNYAVSFEGTNISLAYLTVKGCIPGKSTSSNTAYSSLHLANTAESISVHHCNIIMDISDDYNQDGGQYESNVKRCVWVQGGSFSNFYQNTVAITADENKDYTRHIVINNGGSIVFNGSNSEQYYIDFQGYSAVTIEVSGKSSLSARSDGATYGAILTNSTGDTTGQRYAVSLLSYITTNSAGAEYIPGGNDGTVSSSTYCFYQ